MEATKVLISFYALATALLVAIYRVTSAVYFDSAPTWLADSLHWVMAVGVVLALAANFLYWYRADSSLSVSATFYGTIALTLLFFWVWGCSTFADSDDQIAHIAHAVWWPPVDALYVMVGVTLSRRLWQDRLKSAPA